eukprot:Gb_24499 [translate_table: standard]
MKQTVRMDNERMDGLKHPDPHHHNYGPLSQNGSVSMALLVFGIFVAVITIVIVLIIFTNCSKLRFFNSKVRGPVLPIIGEPHLRINRAQLMAATANFSEQNLIGRGGFSTVYKGILPNGRIIAVKWMKIAEEILAKRNFLAEMKILGRIRHRNLLKILGYFSDAKEMALILEFMPNGSLENLLHGEGRYPLEWKQRLNIAIGIAQGLAYLHHESRTTVVHCDLKPSNVLLDEDFEPHIADFGVAKMSNLHMTESSFGPSWTIGYTAPETAYRLKASSKADVYSFGIILLELISRKRPTKAHMECGLTFVEWIRKAEAEGFVLDVIDEYLKLTPEFHSEIVSVIGLALHCAQDSPVRRPTMREMVGRLMEIRGDNEGKTRLFNVPLDLLLAPPTLLRSNGTSP